LDEEGDEDEGSTDEEPSEDDEEEEPSDDGSVDGDGNVVKVDLSEVDEIWFVKKKDGEGSEKVASLDIISRVVKRYRG